MSGGVRNLRAMFENKEESSISPPDRGRSPAGSIGGGSNGTSPRPLSKVRTSFVAVERSGQLGTQWGLRKEGNADPSLATRRASFSIDEETDPKAVADRKQSIISELSARKSSTAVTEAIPESAIETPPIDTEKRSGYLNGSNEKLKVTPAESKSSGNPDKKTSVEERNTRLLPGDTTSSAAISGGPTLKNTGGFGENLNSNTSGKLKPASPTKGTTKTAPAGRTAKPGPILTAPSTATAQPVSKSTKSPSNPKTPTTPAKTPTTPGKSSKTPTSKPAASSSTKPLTKPADMKTTKSTAGSATASKSATRPTTSSTIATTSENKLLHTSPSTAFHKPRPKSPTKPAKLPASMTAPTASSLSKVATAVVPGRQSLAPAPKTVSRARSHASLSQKQELHHKPSKLENDRPALGRPSTSTLKKQPSRQSLPKPPAPADESFLARMMRPTTSSASKTAEKIITPPRVKTHTRPTTREGPVGHKPHQGLRGSPSTKKLPPALKETKTEESSGVHSSAVGDAAAPATGDSQLQSTPADHHNVISDNAEGGPVAGTFDENKVLEEGCAEEGNTSAPGIPATTEDKDAIQPDEKLVNHEFPNPYIEASESIPEADKPEHIAVTKEPEIPASKSIEVAVDAEEPVVMDEQKSTTPVAEDLVKVEDRKGTNDALEQEEEAQETVTAI